jgi:hypothetical protein
VLSRDFVLAASIGAALVLFAGGVTGALFGLAVRDRDRENRIDAPLDMLALFGYCAADVLVCALPESWANALARALVNKPACCFWTNLWRG